MPESPPRDPSSGSNSMRIRTAVLADAEAIRAIYNHEVENTTATMDLVPRSLDDQLEWLAARSGAFATIVAEVNGEVVGFASLSPYKERAAYRPTVEDSVYVRRDLGGRGIGKALLTAVIELAATSGFHSVMAQHSRNGCHTTGQPTGCAPGGVAQLVRASGS